MENFTSLSGAVTPDVAVLIRAVLLTTLIFGLEALSNARRKVGRDKVTRKVRQPEHARGKLAKKQVVRA